MWLGSRGAVSLPHAAGQIVPPPAEAACAVFHAPVALNDALTPLPPSLPCAGHATAPAARPAHRKFL